MKTNMKYKKIFSFPNVILFYALLSVLFHYVSGSDIQKDMFNSDALYLPTLFSNIFENNGSITEWYLTPAPYFFPDYIIYLISYTLGKTAYAQIVIFSLIQIFVLFVLLYLIIKLTLNKYSSLCAATIITLLVWLSLAKIEPFALLLNSAYHYGAFLSALIVCTLIFAAKQLGNNRYIYHLLIALICYCATLSDNIFIIQFVIPYILVSLFFVIFHKYRMVGLFLPAASFGCAALGSISYAWIISNPTRYSTEIGFDEVNSKLNEVISIFISSLEQFPILYPTYLIYILFIVYSICSKIKGRGQNTELYWLLVFSSISILTTVGAIVLVTNLPITSRYLISAFTWPVIIAVLFILEVSGRNFRLIAGSICFVAIISISMVSYQLFRENGVRLDYYPKDIACVDSALGREGVRNGIAQYWDAKYIANFSKQEPNIAQHYDNLAEMHWITSKSYFRENYDFAIISNDAEPPHRIPAEVVTRINGEPRTIQNCGKWSVYIYGHNKMRTKKFVTAGNSYTWRACELPSVVGEKTAGCEIRKVDTAQPGPVTFGPYEQLPAGDYIFEIEYSSMGNNGETVGDWDVLLALPKEAKVLQVGQIWGTKGDPREVKGRFTLDDSQDMEKIEIRTLGRENADLRVISLRVTRVR